MAHYFLVHDGPFFENHFRPVLSSCWRQRSFLPAQQLCLSLRPRIEDFTARYHISDEPLPLQILRGIPFHRDFWSALVGELLFHAAAEIPEFQTCPETLLALVAPEHVVTGPGPRGELAPILQSRQGSRDLSFGPAFYRPDHCGLNHRGDVERLSGYLEGTNPDLWCPEPLALLPDMEDPSDRDEELALARDWFSLLRDLYRRSADGGR